MRIYPAPFWGNHFLYFYENQFMTESISDNKIKVQHFHSTKLFIDDLCSTNDGGQFGCANAELYPKELEIKLKHQGMHISFLNLDVNIVDGKSVFKLYNKRDYRYVRH